MDRWELWARPGRGQNARVVCPNLHRKRPRLLSVWEKESKSEEVGCEDLTADEWWKKGCILPYDEYNSFKYFK